MKANMRTSYLLRIINNAEMLRGCRTVKSREKAWNPREVGSDPRKQEKITLKKGRNPRERENKPRESGGIIFKFVLILIYISVTENMSFQT